MILNLTVSFPGRDDHEAQLSGAVTQESNSNPPKINE